ncbi:MAG TPA: hypothetical protein VMG10_28655 [Gemmataceae bacterium]|nr:hypothetical protein [Gemmataceae bacterium]
MKGLIGKAAALLCCVAASAGVGCLPDRCVDPCYPIRYNFMARQSVNAAMAPQVQNGHVLDQTIWNYYFDPGTDKLTTGGLERLAYLARRRPCPDTVLYLQTAQDVVYDQAVPEKMVEVRQTLDGKRIAAVQAYLTAQTAGRPVPFQIVIHDPAEPSLAASPVNNAVSQMYFRFMGGLPMMGGMGMGMGGGMGGMGMGMGMGMGGGMGGMGMGMGMGSTGGANVSGGSGNVGGMGR